MFPSSATEYFDCNGHGARKEPENLNLKHSCLLPPIKICYFRLNKKTFHECLLILVIVANKNTRQSPAVIKCVYFI